MTESPTIRARAPTLSAFVTLSLISFSLRHYYTRLRFVTKHRKLLRNINELKTGVLAGAVDAQTIRPPWHQYQIDFTLAHRTHVCTRQIIIVNNLSLLILIDFGDGYGKVFVLATHTHTGRLMVSSIFHNFHTYTNTYARQN